MIDKETISILSNLESSINIAIDKLIKKRQEAFGRDIYFYRFICRKLEQMLGYVHKAMDKVEEQK